MHMKKYFIILLLAVLAAPSLALADTLDADSVEVDSVGIDSIATDTVMVGDTAYVSVAVEDTIQLAPGEKLHNLREVDVLAEKETQLTRAINAALSNSLELNAPGSMSLSDGIRKLRKYSKKERKQREVENNLMRLEQAKTFEELLNEAVMLQQQLDEQEKNKK